MRKALGLAAVAAVFLAGQAAAATLTHAYDFSTSVSGQVLDSVGGANGTLANGATVSGGKLQLNGANDSVDFGTYLLPLSSNSFSVYLRVQGTPNLGGHTEIISQNATGQGFYIGTAPGGTFRFGDANLSTSVLFPGGEAFHDILLTSGGGATNVSIDGLHVFTGNQITIGSTGDYTRLGRQFSPFSENFDGQIDTLKIFSGVATEADLRDSTVPEPASWALMILGMGGIGATLRRLRRTGFTA